MPGRYTPANNDLAYQLQKKSSRFILSNDDLFNIEGCQLKFKECFYFFEDDPEAKQCFLDLCLIKAIRAKKLHILDFLLHLEIVLDDPESLQYLDTGTKKIITKEQFISGVFYSNFTRETINGKTLLGLAASLGRFEIVRYLILRQKADPLIYSPTGNLPIHEVLLNLPKESYKNYLKTFIFLCQHMVQFNIKQIRQHRNRDVLEIISDYAPKYNFASMKFVLLLYLTFLYLIVIFYTGQNKLLGNILNAPANQNNILHHMIFIFAGDHYLASCNNSFHPAFYKLQYLTDELIQRRKNLQSSVDKTFLNLYKNKLNKEYYDQNIKTIILDYVGYDDEKAKKNIKLD